MSQPDPLRIPPQVPGVGRTLRQLYLTLFLRGRSSRGLQKNKAPTSIGTKIGWTLALYAMVGMVALFFRGQTIFTLAASMHAMTFVLLGMFIAASSGELLFNKEEADILLHRPVTAQALLWAKVRVLVEVSLWIAGALNLATCFVGVGMPDGGWIFPLVHLLSLTLEALFCTGCVVLVYQLCLRWFGRERFDGIMTTAQIVIAVAAAVGGQVVPQVLGHLDGHVNLSLDMWWLVILPPVWFAALDAALIGQGTVEMWALAMLGCGATTVVGWSAFRKLAADYGHGLQRLNESTASGPGRRSEGRWLNHLVTWPPYSWLLRDSATRASFMLTAAYLVRDRDTKLRLYPSIAPMLVMPLLMFVRDGSKGGSGGFSLAFVGGFLGIIPLIGVNLVRYSHQWQAADVFRVVPLAGPAALCHGVRLAILSLVTIPVFGLFGVIAWMMNVQAQDLMLILPGLVAMPVYAIIPCRDGTSVPFSAPPEEAKSSHHGLTMICVMIASFILSGLGIWSRSGGWFWWMLVVEAAIAAGLYWYLHRRLAEVCWSSLE